MTSSRFTSRVLLVTVLPLIITAIILASILISERIDEFNKRTSEKGNIIVSDLSQISEYGLFSGNFIYLDSTLTHTLKQSDIVAVAIKDKNKKIVLQKTINKLNNADLKTLDPGRYKIFTSPIIETQIVLNDLDSEPQQNANQKIIGEVHVVMDMNNTRSIKSGIILKGVFITFLSTMATILVALLFSHSVTKPITIIRRSVDLIKKGDLEHRIPVDFSGELSELANGINNMTASLEAAQSLEKQRAEDILFIEKTKAQITLEAIGDGVITTDINGYVTYLNPAAEKLTGYSTEQAINKPLSIIFKVKTNSDDYTSNYPIMDCINNMHKIHHESGCILISHDETEYNIRETASPLIDKEGKVVGAVLIFHDFSNIKKMSDVLAHQATHDDLTGLLNRRAFENKMHEIINSITEQEAHTLCYIDLDRFKVINDTCGHLAGDRLLKIISSKINEHIRKNDLFARLGGDEFGIIFFNCDIEKARLLAENIKNIVSEIQFSWDTHTFNIAASIGIVPVTQNASMTELMMTVDTACYVAKDKGRNRIHVYQQSDEDILLREGDLQWFQKINTALNENNFILFSQKMVPYAENAGDDIYEILIRLQKDGGFILPDVFLPAAERYSIMPKIDRWVIKTLFSKINNNTHFQNNTYFSINLSVQTLMETSFIEFLNNELDNCQISPNKLVFELSETAVMANFTEVTNFMLQFKARGCRFALDDFGSGLSSFQYLSELPVDFIKIDGSFIKYIHENPYNLCVVNSICQIGHSRGLKIVAEFVENEEILTYLDNSLIDYVQGYCLEHPHKLDFEHETG